MTDSMQRTAEEIRLDVFVGEWDSDGKTYPGRFGPGGDAAGTSTYRWEMNSKWLWFESTQDLPGMGLYTVHGGVAYDAQAGNYRAFAYNSLGILIVYAGDWVDDTHLVFDTVFPPPQFPSRIVYIIHADGSIQMNSETAEDGVTFKPYFETTLTRASA